MKASNTIDIKQEEKPIQGFLARINSIPIIEYPPSSDDIKKFLTTKIGIREQSVKIYGPISVYDIICGTDKIKQNKKN